MSIEQDDRISRCLIHRKAFQSGIHVNMALFVFSDSPCESGIMRCLAPGEQDVHQRGCKIAYLQNERLQQPEPGPLRRYYCGFRTAKMIDMILKGEDYEISLCPAEEQGDEAHINFSIQLRAGMQKNEKANTKVEAGLALAAAFGLAIPFLCDIDKDDVHHPLNKDPQCLSRGLPDISRATSGISTG